MQNPTIARSKTGFALVEALLAIVILAGAMIVAAQALLGINASDIGAAVAREARLAHFRHVGQFQSGEIYLTETNTTTPLTLVTLTLSSNVSVTISDQLNETMTNNGLWRLTSTASWTMPNGVVLNQELTGMQRR